MAGSVTATGLTPGRRYYIMVDGFNGDACDFSITITGSRTYGLPLPPGPITQTQGVQTSCVGATSCYSIAPVSGASTYNWTVGREGRIISGQGSTQICIEWERIGGAVVQVVPSNSCYTGVASLKPAVVLGGSVNSRPPDVVCSGAFPVTIDGNVFTAPGNYDITFSTSTGCDSVVQYMIMPQVQTPVPLSRTICRGQGFTLGDSTYTSTTTTTVMLPTPQANGCDSIVELTLEVLDSIEILSALDTISCIDSCIDITVQANLGVSVSTEWSSPNGNLNMDNGLSANVCSRGDYILTLFDSTTMKSCQTSTYVAGDTLGLDSLMTLTANGVMCLGSNYVLETDDLPRADFYMWDLPQGANPTGSRSLNRIEVQFDSLFSGDICVQAVNACDTSNLICAPVNIIAVPNSDFALDANACGTSTAMANYTATLANGFNFNWNFGDLNVISGSGSGPYEIGFPSGGQDYDVTLTIDGNGCAASSSTKTVTADPTYPAPQVTCIPDQNSVRFEWAADPAIPNFEVRPVSGGMGMRNQNSYTVDGLMIGDTVVIEVAAMGSSLCGETVSTASCITQNCPNVTLTPDQNGKIYCDSDSFSEMLTVTATGGTGNGTFSWTGTGVTPDGLLENVGQAPGTYTLEVTYVENSCDFTTTVTYEIVSSPSVSAVVTQPVWQPATTGDIDITINGGTAPVNFTWSNGATTEDLTGVPSGDYCITVEDGAGCQVSDCYAINLGTYFVAPIHLICAGDGKTISVDPISGASFSWSPGTGLSCTICPAPFANPSQSTIYTVTATLPSGQTASTDVEVIVIPPVICPMTKSTINLPNTEQEWTDFDREQLQADLTKVSEDVSNIISLTPNPTTGLITINSISEIIEATAFDLTGRLISRTFATDQMDLSEAPVGTYLIRVKTGDGVAVRRIVKH